MSDPERRITPLTLCPICDGTGDIGDGETPCPAGCDPCWKCRGTGIVVREFCFAIDGNDCCGGYCQPTKEPCDVCA